MSSTMHVLRLKRVEAGATLSALSSGIGVLAVMTDKKPNIVGVNNSNRYSITSPGTMSFILIGVILYQYKNIPTIGLNLTKIVNGHRVVPVSRLIQGCRNSRLSAIAD